MNLDSVKRVLAVGSANGIRRRVRLRGGRKQKIVVVAPDREEKLRGEDRAAILLDLVITCQLHRQFLVRKTLLDRNPTLVHLLRIQIL